jgi:hypothetical protein
MREVRPSVGECGGEHLGADRGVDVTGRDRFLGLPVGVGDPARQPARVRGLAQRAMRESMWMV